MPTIGHMLMSELPTAGSLSFLRVGDVRVTRVYSVCGDLGLGLQGESQQ